MTASLHIKLLGVLMLAVCYLLAPSIASAYTVTDGALEVIFPTSGPLFHGGNIAPGFSTTTSVTVRNLGSETEAVYLQATSTSSDGLANTMTFSAAAPTVPATYFTDTFAALFATSTVYLGDLSAGTTRDYELTAAFPIASGNTFQGTSLGFDLTIGFDGGESTTVNGSGGGGGGGNDDEDGIPPGEVEGVATGTRADTQGLVSGITEVFRALGGANVVAGASDTGGVTTGTTDEEPSETTQTSASISDATLLDMSDALEHCTFLWLLLLGFISLLWTAFEDGIRNTGRHFRTVFLRNSLIHALYFGLLLAINSIGLLPQIWWLFAIAWVGIALFDSYVHHTLGSVLPHLYRNLFYFIASVLLIITHFITGIPCVWLPFAFVSFGAILECIFHTLRG